MFRRKKLSRDRKVPRSDGNTNASLLTSTQSVRHVSMSAASSGGIAASLRIRSVFGSPRLPRYTRSTISAMEHLIRAHRDCQSIYEPFPDIQHREPQVVLLFRHVTLLVPLRFFRRHQRARRVALY